MFGAQIRPGPSGQVRSGADRLTGMFVQLFAPKHCNSKERTAKCGCQAFTAGVRVTDSQSQGIVKRSRKIATSKYSVVTNSVNTGTEQNRAPRRARPPHGRPLRPDRASHHRRPPVRRGGVLPLRGHRAPVFLVPATVVELLLKPRPEAAPLGLPLLLLRSAARGQRRRRRRRLPPLLPQQQREASAAGPRRLGRRPRYGVLPRRARGR
uniref:Uncharacterized protein n=1 Tax=Zea mays TaxID=4577 RepID=C0PAF9_MAIZE|nr:unknown [Zea mays]